MKNIIDSETLSRTIRRLSAEAVELEKGTENVVLIGIRTRGVILARRMQAEIEKLEGVKLPLGILDIALYRDDLLSGSCDAVFKGSEINFDVEGKKVILCDDVLYTGRTVRAALSALSALGSALCAFRARKSRERTPFLRRRQGASGTSFPCGRRGKECADQQQGARHRPLQRNGRRRRRVYHDVILHPTPLKGGIYAASHRHCRQTERWQEHILQ